MGPPRNVQKQEPASSMTVDRLHEVLVVSRLYSVEYEMLAELCERLAEMKKQDDLREHRDKLEATYKKHRVEAETKEREERKKRREVLPNETRIIFPVYTWNAKSERTYVGQRIGKIVGTDLHGSKYRVLPELTGNPGEYYDHEMWVFVEHAEPIMYEGTS